MTIQPAAAVVGDPATLTLQFQHTAQLVDPSWLEIWQVQICADGKPVGSLRAVNGLYGSGGLQARREIRGPSCPEAWEFDDQEDLFSPEGDAQLDRLRSRLSSQGGLCAVVAQQILSDVEVGLREWGSLNVFVFDQLSLSAPFNVPPIAAAVAASVSDLVAADDSLLVFPTGTVTEGGDTALLEAAGRLLWAEQFSDDLCFLDTKFDQREGVAEVRELLSPGSDADER
ncbi:hypothetical protein [Streptomyces sp. S1D4-20]|uniref:hypothetical protein n=1 Tax=Streptomyces sp. S1D4-20 TaxID=2594462 RepID=UPI0011658FEF|nr:hypothetical protein [Streptomyces sp. S1D4-20]QDN54162.1 hypothetical protein FNV67_00885 [Streptomyces sp. S1D4-20]